MSIMYGIETSLFDNHHSDRWGGVQHSMEGSLLDSAGNGDKEQCTEPSLFASGGKSTEGRGQHGMEQVSLRGSEGGPHHLGLQREGGSPMSISGRGDGSGLSISSLITPKHTGRSSSERGSR
jgi:hypothetical protein